MSEAYSERLREKKGEPELSRKLFHWCHSLLTTGIVWSGCHLRTRPPGSQALGIHSVGWGEKILNVKLCQEILTVY